MTFAWTLQLVLNTDLKPCMKGRTKMYILGLLTNLKPGQKLYLEILFRDPLGSYESLVRRGKKVVYEP